MNNIADKFVQANSPDGGFLQSEEWRKFQEAYGRETFHLEGDGFWANIIKHQLPIAGSYFYVPRGPIISHNSELITRNSISELINLAKKENVGWIRIELTNKEILDSIKKNIQYKIIKAPHDVQPREIWVIDIAKPEEQLLSEMKAKTRYNIKLSQKRGVKVFEITNNPETRSKQGSNSNNQNSNYYFDRFIELVKITAQRNEISAHPEKYYRQMWETLPGEMVKLYVAEYEGKIIAANLILFYSQFATYLHGASDNAYREVMAPHLLQWRAIQDAQKEGCKKYDFGGVSTTINHKNKLKGVTKFKLGFSPETQPIKFPGSYDIIIDPWRYGLYRTIQKIKNIF